MTSMDMTGLLSLLTDLKSEAERTRNWLVASQITEVTRWVEWRLKEAA